MATNTKPIKKAVRQAPPKATPAKAWKSKATLHHTMELPSGNVATVRRVGVETFIAQGKVPNSLLGIMKGMMSGKKTEVDLAEVDPQQISDMFALFDAVCIDVCLEPEVLPVPQVGEERDEECLYVDEVDPTDKSFIFQWTVGGTSDLEKFRQKLDATVAGLQSGQAVEPASE